MSSLAFDTGDIFYTLAAQEYQLFKVVATDPALGAYHVLAYAPQPTLPTEDDLPHLPIQIGHLPISADGFAAPVWLARQPVAARELAGYYTYLQHTQAPAERVEEAIRRFNEGLALSDAQQPQEAIEAYTLAYTLVPEFFEAVDNRAFCRMDLGQWLAAITDFEESLRINPGSDLAEFSIGECYFNLRDYAQAQLHFERALALNPDSELAREFMDKIAARGGNY